MKIDTKQIKAVVTISLVALLLTSCAVGPDYQAPELEPVKLFDHEQQPQHANNKLQTTINHDWWQQFNDIHLNKLINIADQYNPSVAIARANLDKAMAIFDDISDDDQLSGFVTGVYSVQRQVIPGDLSAEPERPRLESRRLGLDLSWTVDLVGKFARAEEAAKADAEAAYFAWQDAKLSLLNQVASTYIQYRGAQARLAVAENTLASLSRTQEVVLNQVEVGFASELDALRVKGQLASVKASLPSIRAEAEAARQVLMSLAGGEDNLAGFDWLADEIPSLNKPIALASSTNFLQNRPDVREAERQLAAATAGIGVAKADLYPSLSLAGFLGFLSNRGSVINSDVQAWSVTPSIGWNALDLDSVRARIKIADASQTASLERFELTLLDAIAQTRTSLSNYTQLQQRLHALDEQVEANQGALSLAQYQYKNGAISLLDLLDIERQWLSSRDEKVIAHAQTTRSLVDIYVALGGGVLTTEQ